MGRPQARIGDAHACPGHGTNAVASGCGSVLVNGRPAARTGDLLADGALICTGEPRVLIGGMHAARQSDTSSHGGAIVEGSPDVLVGSQTIAAAPLFVGSLATRQGPLVGVYPFSI